MFIGNYIMMTIIGIRLKMVIINSHWFYHHNYHLFNESLKSTTLCDKCVMFQTFILIENIVYELSILAPIT